MLLEVCISGLQLNKALQLCQGSSEFATAVQLFAIREGEAQRLWSRCVNMSGYPGANIQRDLFMVHLNRRLKTVIHGMSANVSPIAI